MRHSRRLVPMVGERETVSVLQHWGQKRSIVRAVDRGADSYV